MKSHRLLIVSAVLLSLAGCASLLTYGVRSQEGQIGRTTALLEQELSARKQTDERLRKLLASHDQLAQENERLRKDHADLTATHEIALKRLDGLSEEVRQLCKSASANSPLQLPNNWHQRLIAANQPVYTEICATLSGLTEEEFPTVRTWYGEAWRKLTRPFAEHQFPAEAQRDQLVKLLNDIMAAERQRMQALGEQPILTVSSDQPNAFAGHGLGPQWEQLAANLRSLRY